MCPETRPYDTRFLRCLFIRCRTRSGSVIYRQCRNRDMINAGKHSYREGNKNASRLVVCPSQAYLRSCCLPCPRGLPVSSLLAFLLPSLSSWSARLKSTCALVAFPILVVCPSQVYLRSCCLPYPRGMPVSSLLAFLLPSLSSLSARLKSTSVLVAFPILVVCPSQVYLRSCCLPYPRGLPVSSLLAFLLPSLSSWSARLKSTCIFVAFPILVVCPSQVYLRSCCLPYPRGLPVSSLLAFLLPSLSSWPARLKSTCVLVAFPILVACPSQVYLRSCCLPYPRDGQTTRIGKATKMQVDLRRQTTRIGKATRTQVYLRRAGHEDREGNKNARRLETGRPRG